MNLQIFLYKVKKMRIAQQQYERLVREGSSKKNIMDLRLQKIKTEDDVDRMINDLEKNLNRTIQTETHDFF